METISMVDLHQTIQAGRPTEEYKAKKTETRQPHTPNGEAIGPKCFERDCCARCKTIATETAI